MKKSKKKGSNKPPRDGSKDCTTLAPAQDTAAITTATAITTTMAMTAIMGMTITEMEDFYDLDPDGDVILTFSIPLESVIDISPPEAAAGVQPSEATPASPNDEVERDIGAEPEQEALEEPSSPADPDVRSVQSEDTFSVIASDPDCDSPPSDPLSHRTISFLVSSPHLRLASPVFRTLLQQHARKGGPQRTTIPIHNDDPRALLTLLYILHLRMQKVPDSVSLDSLAKMAALVDKYNCAEAIAPFSRMWIDKLKSERPDTFSDALFQWLYITWVFKEHQEFESAIKIIQREGCDSDIAEKAKEFQIPDSLLDTIHGKRKEAISGIIDMLQGLVERYKETTTIRCGNGSQDCDAMVLGSLIRGMKTVGLRPPPEPPYEGLSTVGLVNKLARLPFPSHCASYDGSGFSYGYGRSCSGMKDLVNREIRKHSEK
ncbi:hypothetical protein GP486_006333 [Trichoglossum hirsutum]|uniref:BTB domain-containing protein n=1 Tax=Trichoglossum hirsutum TaxID=265104 RepID=A0A9P8L3T0_9PEZI|nr:hypothetical protein GP486_006333 [Trichoglossum hirsutum]